jgi:hypothetical protein
MQQIQPYSDDRASTLCVFCGSPPKTRDHCPSKVLLDAPYPTNLAIVPSCAKCNHGFSMDEEYFACLVATAIAGAPDPAKFIRTKAARILESSPLLRERLLKSQYLVEGTVAFLPEDERVKSVLLKNARGHAFFELNEHFLDGEPDIWYVPLHQMTDAQRNAFESVAELEVFPEVGSRGMQRMLVPGTQVSKWIEVQNDVYRYQVVCAKKVAVKIVLQNYLACQVEF